MPRFSRGLAIAALVISTGAGAEPVKAPAADRQVAGRVAALLAQMTLDEKIGQLTQIAGAPFFPGPKPEETVRKGGAGSVLWLNDAKQFNALQKIAVDETR